MSKILVVEDDKNISQALSIRLKSENFSVFSAEDAVQATTMYNKYSPDVVLMDITIPGGNGFIVAERIQEMNDSKLTPIIFITASKSSEFEEKAKEVGGV